MKIIDVVSISYALTKCASEAPQDAVVDEILYFIERQTREHASAMDHEGPVQIKMTQLSVDYDKSIYWFQFDFQILESDVDVFIPPEGLREWLAASLRAFR